MIEKNSKELSEICDGIKNETKKTKELGKFKSSLRGGIKYIQGKKTKAKVENISIYEISRKAVSKRIKTKGLKPKDVEKAIEDLRRKG